MPGVQKPQCSACFSWKPCCTGSSCPSTSSDSTVLISWPSHMTASVVHDFTGLPSMSTTQAPQLDVSQPQCVPVSPSVSRMKCTSSMRGSTSAVCASPLIVTVTCIASGLLLERTGRRTAQSAFRDHPGEVALVVDRAAAVGDRHAVLRGDRARLLEQLVRGRAAAQQLLRAGELDRHGAEGAEAD